MTVAETKKRKKHWTEFGQQLDTSSWITWWPIVPQGDISQQEDFFSRCECVCDITRIHKNHLTSAIKGPPGEEDNGLAWWDEDWKWPTTIAIMIYEMGEPVFPKPTTTTTTTEATIVFVVISASWIAWNMVINRARHNALRDGLVNPINRPLTQPVDVSPANDFHLAREIKCSHLPDGKLFFLLLLLLVNNLFMISVSVQLTFFSDCLHSDRYKFFSP